LLIHPRNVQNKLSHPDVSAGRAADIKGRSFSQLSTLKKLLDEGVLKQGEFDEQKETILRGLRKL
jgi:hypothetical protein